MDDHYIEKEIKGILDEIFCFDYLESEKEDPFSWALWKEGKSNYKPFSLQFRQCTVNETAFLEECPICGQKLIMCKRYGGQCRSDKCRDIRIENSEEL